MHKVQRYCLILLGVTSALIGTLHLAVHFMDLVSVDLQQRLAFTVPVSTSTTPLDVFGAWQGFSYMMGASFIVIGLLLLAQGLKTLSPSLLVYIALLGFFCATIFSGFNYFGPQQIYGGTFGIVVTLIALFARFRYLGEQID